MVKLDYQSVLELSESEVSRTVRLTSFSISMLLSWLVSPEAVFWWNDLSDNDRDAADAAYSKCVRELMTSAMIGLIVYGVYQSTPDNWIPCNGQALNMADWPELMEVYPNILKNYPSAGLFTVPDGRGRVLIGDGTSSWGVTYSFLQTGGSHQHTLTQTEMPVHNHGESVAVPAVINGGLEAPASAAVPGSGLTGNAGSGQPHNNMPPYGVAHCYLVGR